MGRRAARQDEDQELRIGRADEPGSSLKLSVRVSRSERLRVLLGAGEASRAAGRSSVTIMAIYAMICHWLKRIPPVASMNVSVPDPMRDWVQQRVESGQYASVSDYMRDLIRRDQLQANERDTLIAALIEGEQSGVSTRRIPEILATIKQKLRGRSDE